MKVAAATAALVFATTAAAAGPLAAPTNGVDFGPIPHLSEVLEKMPPEIAMNIYIFPPSYIQGIIAGSIWLPTEADEILSHATVSLPASQYSLISSKYVEFISAISTLLPKPTGAKEPQKTTSTPKPTSPHKTTSTPKPTNTKSKEHRSGESDSESDEGDGIDTISGGVAALAAPAVMAAAAVIAVAVLF
ncbi:hypothetical protein H4R19_003349 [Coemansia spiralis]|nr:hypothetical protein H4R19_003349 [Coemansia spiralis]